MRDLPWVAGNPDFGKSEDIDAFLAGFVDEVDRFLDGTLEIEPDGFGLDSAEADG